MLSPFPNTDAIGERAGKVSPPWWRWFDALRTAVNGADTRVTALEAQIAALEARVTELEGP